MVGTSRGIREMTKAEQIKNTLQKTRKRRKNQRAVVYQLKLQNLSEKKEKLLKRSFAEAKWLYNWLVSDIERLNIPANKVNTVEVKVGESFEERSLTALESQIKQEIAERLKDNLKALVELKRKRRKVGALKPKKFVNSIPLNGEIERTGEKSFIVKGKYGNLYVDIKEPLDCKVEVGELSDLEFHDGTVRSFKFLDIVTYGKDARFRIIFTPFRDRGELE